MAWAVATCFFWSAVLSLTFPSMLDTFDVTGSFCFYAGLNVLAFIMIWLFVPETSKLSLEELDSVFDVPTKEFQAHNWNRVLPHWWKTTILRQKLPPLEPLLSHRKVEHDM
jgi:hypothetical protein